MIQHRKLAQKNAGGEYMVAFYPLFQPPLALGQWDKVGLSQGSLQLYMWVENNPLNVNILIFVVSIYNNALEEKRIALYYRCLFP